MEFFLISMLNGLSYGLLLFMLSSGLTLIFSMMGVLNFAHASFYMLGAYLGYTIARITGFWPALVLAPLLVGALGGLSWGAPLSQAFPALQMMTQWLAPAQANPLDINPLRRLLERVVDFDLLCATRKAVPQVFVCATNVRTGRGEIFAGPRLSADAVMASACLPLVFKAVEIDGDRYWDGGYSGNPALHPLIYQTECSDILLVQINPIEHLGVPDTVPEIMDRLNEVTFNASLLAELRAIEFVRRLLAEGKLDPRRYKDVRMHRIDGGSVLAGMGFASKARADLGFLRRLFTLGRTAGLQWLAAHRPDVGVRASLNLAHNA